jgi:uncharacterized integral membrane protein
MMNAWGKMNSQKGDEMPWLKILIFFWALMGGLFMVRLVSERYRKYRAAKNKSNKEVKG